MSADMWDMCGVVGGVVCIFFAGEVKLVNKSYVSEFHVLI